MFSVGIEVGKLIKKCELCGNELECESVSHVLLECSAYSSSRVDFLSSTGNLGILGIKGQ